MHTRVATALTGLVGAYATSAVIAVVTHGGVMRTALALLATGRLPLVSGHPPVEAGPILNASILHLEVVAGAAGTAWRVVRINDVDHLETSAITARDAG